MNCYKHYDRVGTAQCVDCGKALCHECTSKFTVPICDQCELERITRDKQLLIKNSILMILLFLIGMSINSSEPLPTQLLTGYFFAGIPWGWSILTNITPNIFLFMSVIGWIIYFFTKLFLAMLIGMFVTPYQIYKIITGLKTANELINYTSESQKGI